MVTQLVLCNLNVEHQFCEILFLANFLLTKFLELNLFYRFFNIERTNSNRHAIWCLPVTTDSRKRFRL